MLSQADRKYLEGVMRPLRSDYLLCTRCGLNRAVKQKDGSERCRSCMHVRDVQPVKAQDTPCVMSPRFRELEAGFEGVVEKGGITRAGYDTLRELKQDLNNEFCGACPIREACLEWSREDGYSGPAGGELVRNGKPIEIPEPRPKPTFVPVTAQEKYAELERNGEPRATCACHGEPMSWRMGSERGGGHWICAVKRRAALRQYAKAVRHVRVRASEKYAELERTGEPRPVCDCHGEQMIWDSSTGPDGGYWLCVVKRRERKNRYRRKKRAEKRRIAA